MDQVYVAKAITAQALQSGARRERGFRWCGGRVLPYLLTKLWRRRPAGRQTKSILSVHRPSHRLNTKAIMRINSDDLAIPRRMFLCVALLLCGMIGEARAQYGGLFVSATPQTPIQLGQPLNITVVVKNDTGDIWEEGFDIAYSWLTTVDTPSWSAPWTSMGFGSRAPVDTDETASMMVTVDPTELPASPGAYSVRLATSYNWVDWLFLMDGSPKTVNFTINAANNPPVVTPIGDKTAVETRLLSFSVTATDSDVPAQTLTFSLDPGAPTGASINPTNGTFAWTPPADYAPGTNQITVRVTDNGSPPLSGTNTFSVVVIKGPRFTAISPPVDGIVTLVWEAISGKNYRVQYKDDLSTEPWTDLGGEVTASGPTASTTDNIANAPQRFYQVLLLE
jgi:hypothetical protein